MTELKRDTKYVGLLLKPLEECKKYKPVFGKIDADEEEVTIDAFRSIYGADPLYHWVGLDEDLMYAAHKAAGGMTSIYRQLGIGCERLVRAIIADEFDLDTEQLAWSYKYETDRGKVATHTLDARVDVNHIRSKGGKKRVSDWLQKMGKTRGLTNERMAALHGVVLEVRQGYMSADSKRQQADLRFGVRSYNENYLPMIMIMSMQVSEMVCARYRSNQVAVLTGTPSNDEMISSLAFVNNVIGYDITGFFTRNTKMLRAEFGGVLRAILTP